MLEIQMENEQEFEREISHQGDAPSAGGQLPDEASQIQSENMNIKEQNTSGADLNNESQSNSRLSRRAPTFGGTSKDCNSK